MPLTQTEADHIVQQIQPRLLAVTNEYDFTKYPANAYHAMKEAFAALAVPQDSIENALVWKWGHWGKPNYPQHHRELIAKIQALWNEFADSESTTRAHDTFLWWQGKLASTSYITVAFITHLVHHRQALPIIDQHNFRAMNALITSARPGHHHKKKPSNWNDIATLKSFMELLCEQLPTMSFGDLDRFLMMYGRNHVAR